MKKNSSKILVLMKEIMKEIMKEKGITDVVNLRK